MRKMSSAAEGGRGDLRQRLEILRVQGARHRLELAMSLETLASETGGIRRGLGRFLSLLGLVAGGGTGKSVLRTVLRGLIPVALSMFAGTRAARSAGRLRNVLEAGALGLLIYRTIKRALNKSGPKRPPETQKDRQGDTVAGVNAGGQPGADRDT